MNVKLSERSGSDKPSKFLKIGQIIAIVSLYSLFALTVSFDGKMKSWSFLQFALGAGGLILVWGSFRTEKISMIGVLVGLLLLLIVQIVAGWKSTMAIGDMRQAVYFIMAAVSEELFFRGLIITPSLRSQNPILMWGSVILSSLAFSFIHFNYWGQNDRLFLVFFSGIVLGFIYISFRSITTNILCHLIINLIAVGSVMYY